MATLTGIRLRNFKAVGDEPIELRLAPITLLYGPNGAGKSSILHALHYAREVLERGNVDPDRTLTGGDIDFGGFRNLVHGRDLTRDILLGFDLDLQDDGLPSFGIASDERTDMGLEGRLKSLDLAERLSLDIQVGWSRDRGRPFVRRWEVGIDGEPFAALSAADITNVTFSDLNFEHSYLNDWDSSSTPPTDEERNNSNLGTVLFGEGVYGALGARGTDGALPNLDRPLDLEMLYRGSVDESQDVRDDPEAARRLRDRIEQSTRAEQGAILYVSRVIVGGGQLLRDALRTLLYIGPLRSVPPRDFRPVRSPDRARWSSGLAAWDRLNTTRDMSLLKNVSHWLSDRLHSGFRLHIQASRESDTGGRLDSLIRQGPLIDDLENIGEAYRALPERREISLYDLRRDVSVQPHDVGIGISQLLPVIVAALDTREALVAIEQPELHVHPALQTELGDLFAEAVAPPKWETDPTLGEEDHWYLPDPDLPTYRTNARTLLVETHSEHLILRLLRRIREFGESKIQPGDRVVRPALIAVYYAEPIDAGIQLHELRVDETGEFVDRWPKGFFAERRKELF